MPRFSLMFFSCDARSEDREQRYRLVLESARFADRHGLEAIWLP